VAENLSVPWGLAFLPHDNMLVTERPGRLTEISRDGTVVNEIEISGVSPQGEGGLLGLALHPNFSSNRQLYLYQTYETGGGTQNRVVRYRYRNGSLTNQKNIITGIPGARYHDGGRIAFGPDGRYLFITTGDAGNPREAQATSTLNGKVLRLQPNGDIPDANPFDNPVYSFGHRNPQGLAWTQSGRLFSTEHGRSGFRSGLDEVNLIKLGGNYGWPYFEGEEACGTANIYDPAPPESIAGTSCDIIPPMAQSGPDITWAPASATIAGNTIYFGGLRGQAVYTASIQPSSVELQLGGVRAHLKETHGRIRTVKVGPDKEYLYITTSNDDGRGNPQENDDRIIRIPLGKFE
jgi:glucose/arabinose dehydrogenase